MIKVVDIFAGPGGLSEGFSAVVDKQRRKAFDVVLSVEMDSFAHQTLQLRAFFRQFGDGAPKSYYQYLRGEITREELYRSHPTEAAHAKQECWNATLGPGGVSAEDVRNRIDNAVGKDEDWVLIGGPPCQAYSIAGRSRNQGNPDYDPRKDGRQRLYVEYLQILAEHRPAVFVMENVKGLLSATLESERIFHRILEDLRSPGAALTRAGRPSPRIKTGGYRIYSLVERRLFENGDVEGAVIHAEKFGIPQARHRVILLGVRDDFGGRAPGILKVQPEVPISSVLTLPKLRSGLSKVDDSADAWSRCLRSQVNSRWANAGTRKADSDELGAQIRKVLEGIVAPPADRGGEFFRAEVTSSHAPRWYCDSGLEGVCNHRSRSHMETDLYRYLYASCFAKLRKRSPALSHFPTDLLPAHENVEFALDGGTFSDRFRVQLADRPSTTIVSHISKDGHYYIHPDPSQCRSLTVREAARLQTFPDNYFFCGPKTRQYIQVGNAVPPFLAKQIGVIAFELLTQAEVKE
jgi:DNA (cytosine-5)-methyltransferase 1